MLFEQFGEVAEVDALLVWIFTISHAPGRADGFQEMTCSVGIEILRDGHIVVSHDAECACSVFPSLCQVRFTGLRLQHFCHSGIVSSAGHYEEVTVVFCSTPDHGWSADIDFFDDGLLVIGRRHSLFERV